VYRLCSPRTRLWYVAFGSCVSTQLISRQLKARLSYSGLFGSHILGAVKSLAELEVKKDDDIEIIIDDIIRKKLLASQVNVLVAKVCLISR
jgi:hypothetical protein